MNKHRSFKVLVFSDVDFHQGSTTAVIWRTMLSHSTSYSRV